MQGQSLSWLLREREELLKDRHAFLSALDIMEKRVLASNETAIPRNPLLHQWSGTRSVIGSLEMSSHAIERTLEDVNNLIRMIESGEIPNLDPKPRLVSI